MVAGGGGSSSGNSASSAASFQVLLLLLVFQVRAETELPDSFGRHSHQFEPVPDTLVGAFCRWKLRLNTVPGRVPLTVTEIVCRDRDSHCGGTVHYKCRQMRATMAVGFLEAQRDLGVEDESVAIVKMENRTFSIGCQCVQTPLNAVTSLRDPGIEERKKKKTSDILPDYILPLNIRK